MKSQRLKELARIGIRPVYTTALYGQCRSLMRHRMIDY